MESQDRFVIKAPKKTPLLLRTVVLLLATAFGVYICFLCLKQVSSTTLQSPKLRLQPTQSQADFHEVPSMQPKLLTVPRVLHPPILVNTVEQARGQQPPIMSHQSNSNVLENKEVICNKSGIEPWEMPYVHYPKPKTYNRKECACNRVHYFAILTLQRSGSRWLETLLNNHTNVSSYGEIFIKESRRENISSILQTLDKLYNLDWSRSSSRRECSAAVGFKWMLNQGLMEHHGEIVDYFKKKGVSAIFLFRRNMLRRMISRVANMYGGDTKLPNGKHKAHTHMPVEAQLLARYKPTVGPKRLVPKLMEEEKRIQMALEYFKSIHHIVLYYEDLVRNKTKLRDIQEFLRLQYRELQSHEVKIHKGPISDQIANWDKVQKALKGTKYEHFLHSDYHIGSSD